MGPGTAAGGSPTRSRRFLSASTRDITALIMVDFFFFSWFRPAAPGAIIAPGPRPCWLCEAVPFAPAPAACVPEPVPAAAPARPPLSPLCLRAVILLLHQQH